MYDKATHVSSEKGVEKWSDVGCKELLGLTRDYNELDVSKKWCFELIVPSH